MTARGGCTCIKTPRGTSPGFQAPRLDTEALCDLFREILLLIELVFLNDRPTGCSLSPACSEEGTDRPSTRLGRGSKVRWNSTSASTCTSHLLAPHTVAGSTASAESGTHWIRDGLPHTLTLAISLSAVVLTVSTSIFISNAGAAGSIRVDE